MESFQLGEDAIFDLDLIWRYFVDNESVHKAVWMRTELFKCFYKIGKIPNCGHRRGDLTKKRGPVLQDLF